MSFFDLDPTATENLMNQARLNPINPESMKPGWFAGAWKGVGTGLASVVNDAALLAGDVGTTALRSPARSLDQVFGTKVEDWLNSEQQKAVDNIKNWAPDPRTTGVVGNVVHGLFNVVPEAALGGPAGAATLQGYKGFRGGMADGLDPGTALGKGAIDAVSTWVGLKLPMHLGQGYGAAANVATGAALNLPVGMVSRGATAEWLRHNGYSDMAEQYKVLDTSAIVTDLILGGAFGALGHYGPGVGEKYAAWRDRYAKDIQPSDIDTVLGLNNQLHLELDTAPGIPADHVAREAHVEAMHKSLDALINDKPLELPEAVLRADFVEKPRDAVTRTEVVRAVEDHLGADWRAMKVELEKRGLPTDEIDQSGVYRPTERVVERGQPGEQAAGEPGRAGEGEAAKRPDDMQASQPDVEAMVREALQDDAVQREAAAIVAEKRTIHIPADPDFIKSAIEGRLKKSQARDKNGKLLLVYHGTLENFDKFDASKTADGAIHFGTTRQARNRVSNLYGDPFTGELDDGDTITYKAAHLDIRNMKTLKGDPGDNANWTRAIEKAKKEGFDGIRYQNGVEGDGWSYAVFDAGQIIEVSSTTLDAKHLLAHADVEIASAEKDSQGFEAAVACALRG